MEVFMLLKKLLPILSLFFVIGMLFANGRDCRAEEGATDESFIGSYDNTVNGYSHVGVMVRYNNVPMYYMVDHWKKSSSGWIYESTTDSGQNFVSYNTGSDAGRFIIHASYMTNNISRYSVVLRQYRQGVLLSTETEIAMGKTVMTNLKGLSYAKNDNITLGSYNGDGVSYVYDVYHYKSIPYENISVDTDDGTLSSNGEAYMLDTGCYIGSLPSVTREKQGYTCTFLGWFISDSTEREVHEGDVIPFYTVLRAKWQLTPKQYPVTCIDIAGTDTGGKQLGVSYWDADFGSIAGGSSAGDLIDTGMYYAGCRYTGDTKAIVTVSGAVVYRYFTYQNYPVDYVDVIADGSQKGTELSRVSKELPYQTVVSGAELGEDSTAGTYYKGYFCSRVTTETVGTAGTTVYRYFKPVSYQICFDGNGSTAGKMAELSCSYDESVELTKNLFQREHEIILYCNADKEEEDQQLEYVSQKFLGWALQPDGEVRFLDGVSVKNLTDEENQTVTLYAVWSEEKINIAYTPVRLGYRFCGWSEKENDTTGAACFSVLEDMELYAVWKPDVVAYHVEYYKENSSGKYEMNASYEFYGYTGKEVLAESLDNVFQGYAIDEKASVLSGKIRADGSLILTVYYQRKEYNLTYDINVSGLKKEFGEQAEQLKYGQNITLMTPAVTRTGYLFQGWCEDASGKGTVYTEENTYSMPNHDSVVYAVWTPVQYQVSFLANLPEGKETEQKMKPMTVAYANSVSLSACTYQCEGYSFDSWNTKADGSGKSFSEEASVKNLASAQGDEVMLYAQWTPGTYQIVYDKNVPSAAQGEVSGIVADTVYTYLGDSYASLSKYRLYGYEMTGWNTKADGTGLSVSFGQQLNGLLGYGQSCITLYAVWKSEQNIAFTLNCFIEDDKTQESTLLDTLILLGTAGETVRSALEEIYCDGDQGAESAQYFYSGYRVENVEELETRISGDSSTELSLQLVPRECVLSIKGYQQNQLTVLQQEETAYMGDAVLPSVLESGIAVSRYISQDGVIYPADSTVCLKRNLTVYPQCCVQLIDESEEKTQYVIYGKNFMLPELQKNGYAFSGWYLADQSFAGKGGQNFGAVTENICLYSEWSEPLTYSISYDIDDTRLQILENKVTSYQYLSEVMLPTETQILLDSAYYFAGWYDSGDAEQTIITKIEAGSYGDKVLKACLIKKSGDTEDTDTENTEDNEDTEDNEQTEEGQANSTESGLKTGNSANESDSASLTKKTFWKSGLQYRILSSKTGQKRVRIVAVKKGRKKISLPKQIKYQDVIYNVSGIKDKCFSGNKEIEKLTVHLSAIPQKAFCNMGKLKSVVLAKEVQTIGKKAFSGDRKLCKVTVKCKKLIKTGRAAFKNIRSKSCFQILPAKYKEYRKKILSSGFISQSSVFSRIK
ncbi:MAG: InlB B-repeat-containing protein [Clostridiaceae bacterium]|nr:InlB B-repeat-containing protein [Clostridiaceae bacterium]